MADGIGVSEASSTPVRNLRIHLYGTQGSGSTYPTRPERAAYQELTDTDLLEHVFADLTKRAGPDGKVSCTVEEIIKGPLNRRTLAAYRKTLPAADPRSYGGWTTCIRVETADGEDLIFDCGSGFRACAKDLQAKWGSKARREVHIFGSHSHLDHTEGFDQAPLCFDPRNTLHIYGNRQFLRALDSNLGIFSRSVAENVRGMHTPIFFAIMPAKFVPHEICNVVPTSSESEEVGRQFHDIAEPMRIGDTSIQAFEVFHPAPCLAYRVERAGKVFIFCTDHELRHGADPDHPAQLASVAAEARLAKQCAGADLLYRDGQYLRAEYDGIQGIGNSGAVPRVDWGHSCFEDVIEMAQAADVKHTLIGHHDPNRDWSERNWLDGTLGRMSVDAPNKLQLAQAETIWDL